jgi:hypothetical protein
MVLAHDGLRLADPVWRFDFWAIRQGTGEQGNKGARERGIRRAAGFELCSQRAKRCNPREQSKTKFRFQVSGLLATSETKQFAKTINCECSFRLSVFSFHFLARFAASETKKLRRQQKCKNRKEPLVFSSICCERSEKTRGKQKLKNETVKL